MFRQTKRKPKIHRGVLRRKDDDDDNGDGGGESSEEQGPIPSLRRQDNEKDDDEEEESPVVVIRRHKDQKSFVSQKTRKETSRSLNNKRGANLLSRSSGDEDHENENESGDNNKEPKRKKHRSKGLGFGGMTMMIDEDGDDIGMPDVQQETSDHESPAYGKKALEALKAAQSIEKPKELQEAPVKSLGGGDSLPAAASTSRKEENYISLHDDIPEVIDDHDDAPIVDEETAKPIILEDPDDNDWEEQVARRAGIQYAAKSSKPVSRPPASAPTLDMLRENLMETVQNLSAREEDLGNAIMRREADLAQTRADKQRQQASIEESGKACGDYQKLRYQLAMWVGALRDLDEKVEPILKSILDMISLQFETAHQEWIHWQDDVCVTLREFQRLDRVLGRPPPDTSAEETQAQLDEFGRDIGSQLRRDRENRCRRRRERADAIVQRGGNVGDILEYLWTTEEPTDKRFDILQEALRVALDDLDEEYASPSKLEETFDTWKKEYPGESRQCYANLSLAALAHVFDQVELCRSKWVRGLLKSDEDISLDQSLFPNSITISQDEGDPDSASASSAMEAAFKKQFLPFLRDLLRDHPSTLFLSKQLSDLFGGSIPEIVNKMGVDSQSSKDLCGTISSAGASVLQSLSIPVVKVANYVSSDNFQGATNERVEDALLFARSQQSMWIQRMILNMLEVWLPALQKASETEFQNLGRTILGFLSETYLYFLSSLSANQEAAARLAPIWKCLSQNYQDWLESPELILQSAPLRAAASAYDLMRVQH